MILLGSFSFSSQKRQIEKSSGQMAFVRQQKKVKLKFRLMHIVPLRCLIWRQASAFLTATHTSYSRASEMDNMIPSYMRTGLYTTTTTLIDWDKFHAQFSNQHF